MSSFVTYYHRILLSFFALLMFSNVTLGFAVDIHLCQGDFYSVAFFGNKACCEKMASFDADAELPSCCDKKKPTEGVYFSSKSCCSNEDFIQDGVFQSNADFNFSPTAVDINFIQENFILETTFIALPPLESEIRIPPPPLLRYMHEAANLQVFLI